MNTRSRKIENQIRLAAMSVNSFVFVALLFGYWLFIHRLSLAEVQIAFCLLAGIAVFMSTLMPRIDRKAHVEFCALLDRESVTMLSTQELSLIRRKLIDIPWRAAIGSTIVWTVLVPALLFGASQMCGERSVSWLALEIIALTISPITFLANLLVQEKLLSPFVQIYFPGGKTDQYGSALAITDSRRLVAALIVFGPYSILVLLALGAETVLSSLNIPEAINRLVIVETYAVLILTALTLYFSWRRKSVKGGLTDATVKSIQSAAGDTHAMDVTQNIVGTTLGGKYKLVDILGEGGMSVVYRGVDANNEMVAVKILTAKLASDVQAVKRMEREAKSVSSVQHGNIIAVREFGTTADGLPYLVMDYVDGKSLTQIMRQEKLSPLRTIHILLQLCSALEQAHSKSVIHRDLKPSNVMIETKDGSDLAKLVDFGIAKILTGPDQDLTKLTMTGDIFGSPAYMSPEQCQGSALDARSDIYSLGCLMHEMFVGRTPFSGENAVALIHQHVHQDLPEVQLPPSFPSCAKDQVVEILQKCLVKDPGNRYQHVSEVAQALGQLESAIAAGTTGL